MFIALFQDSPAVRRAWLVSVKQSKTAVLDCLTLKVEKIARPEKSETIYLPYVRSQKSEELKPYSLPSKSTKNF